MSPDQAEPQRTCPVCGLSQTQNPKPKSKKAHCNGAWRTCWCCPFGFWVLGLCEGMLRGAEVAERLGISRQRVHVLAQQGRLEGVQREKLVFSTKASVTALERGANADSQTAGECAGCSSTTSNEGTG